jgi:hypothetical protein
MDLEPLTAERLMGTDPARLPFLNLGSQGNEFDLVQTVAAVSRFRLPRATGATVGVEMIATSTAGDVNHPFPLLNVSSDATSTPSIRCVHVNAGATQDSINIYSTSHFAGQAHGPGT